MHYISCDDGLLHINAIHLHAIKRISIYNLNDALSIELNCL